MPKPAGRKKKRKRGQKLGRQDVARSPDGGVLSPRSPSSESSSDVTSCSDLRARTAAEKLEALAASIEESCPVVHEKVKKRKKRTAAKVLGALPEHAETQLYEVITIDSLYPRSIRILNYGWLDASQDLLASIATVQEPPEAAAQSASTLHFGPVFEREVDCVKYRVTLTAVPSNPLGQSDHVPGTSGVAELDVTYPPSYPEALPRLELRFSFILPSSIATILCQDISALLQQESVVLQPERIIPICERVVAVLADWQASDSALWEQMQSRRTEKEHAEAVAAAYSASSASDGPGHRDALLAADDRGRRTSFRRAQAFSDRDEEEGTASSSEQPCMPSDDQDRTRRLRVEYPGGRTRTSSLLNHLASVGENSSAEYRDDLQEASTERRASGRTGSLEKEIQRECRRRPFWDILDIQAPVHYADADASPFYRVSRTGRRRRRRHHYTLDGTKRRPEMLEGGGENVRAKSDVDEEPQSEPLSEESRLAAAAVARTPSAPKETGPQRKLSRYTKDFEELTVLGTSTRQVVSKVRHRIDCNLYAVKRIAWPSISATSSNWRGSQGSLHRLAQSSLGLEEETSPGAGRCSVGLDPLSQNTRRAVAFSSELYRRVMLAVSRLSHLQHENIARVFQGWVQRVFPDERKHLPFLQSSSGHEPGTPEHNVPHGVSDRVLCVQMEFCPGPTLRSLIDAGKLGQREYRRVWDIFRQLLDVIVTLHGDQLYHRALHPGNVFVDAVDQTTIKVGDFGLANLIWREAAVFYGSHWDTEHDPCPNLASSTFFPEPSGSYLPPDFFRASLLPAAGQPTPLLRKSSGTPCVPPQLIDEKCDLFALGLILFEMLAPPFTSKEKRFQALHAITSRSWTEAEVAALVGSSPAATLIFMLTDPDPMGRPSASEMLFNEALGVPTAVPKSLMKQFLHRLRSTATSESATVLPLLFFRTLDAPTSDRFFDGARAPIASQLSPKPLCFGTESSYPLWGLDFDQPEVPCHRPKRPNGGVSSSGAFFHYLLSSLGLDGALLPIAVARDFVWQTVERVFLAAGAQMADLGSLRLSVARCDCGSQLSDDPLHVPTDGTARASSSTDRPNVVTSDTLMVCWRSAMGHLLSKERQPGGCVVTQRPFVLLDMAGALVTLATDLTYLLAAFCASLVADGRGFGKSPLIPASDVPPCFRLYAIRSVHHEGPFFSSLGTSSDLPPAVASSKEPTARLRAVYSVAVALNIALRDSLWDTCSMQLNLLVLQAEHILSVLDAVLPLNPYIAGSVEVVWSHTDLLRYLMVDVCRIFDADRLSLLDVYIRLLGLPKEATMLRYLLFLCPPEDISAATALGQRITLSEVDQASIDAVVQEEPSCVRTLKLWRVLAKEFRNLVKCLTCCQWGDCCASHRVAKPRQSMSRAVRCKELIIASHHHLAMPEFREVFDAAVIRVGAAFGALDEHAPPALSRGAAPPFDSTLTTELLRNLTLVESTFHICRDFDTTDSRDCAMETSIASIPFIFDVTLNYDRCAYNTIDGLVFHAFVSTEGDNNTTKKKQFCVASGGRHDAFIGRHLTYRTGYSVPGRFSAKASSGPKTSQGLGKDRLDAIVAQFRRSVHGHMHPSPLSFLNRLRAPITDVLQSGSNAASGSMMAFASEIDLERLAEQTLAVEYARATTITPTDQSSRTHAPPRRVLEHLTPSAVIIAQKHRHEIEGFRLLAKMTRKLHLRTALRVCPIWDLAKFRERLLGHTASLFCLVVLQPKTTVGRHRHDETTTSTLDMAPLSPRLPSGTDDGVLYRVEFFAADPAYMALCVPQQLLRGTGKHLGTTTTRNVVKTVETDHEVLQIISHVVQRLLR